MTHPSTDMIPVDRPLKVWINKQRRVGETYQDILIRLLRPEVTAQLQKDLLGQEQ